MAKLDLTSTALEKGIDTAKVFLEKLLMPAIEETGLLLKDQISRFRFNNQLKMLISADAKCKKAGIDPKTISFKLLCPLLDGASLEEEEEMIDVWASLLSNLVDAEQNIENHIFPYLLSQISIEEWEALKQTYQKYVSMNALVEDLPNIVNRAKQVENEQLRAIEKAKQDLAENKIDAKQKQSLIHEANKKIDSERQLVARVRKAKYQDAELEYSMISESYHYSNLYRLGIINRKPIYHTSVTEPKGGIVGQIENRTSYYNDDAYESQKLNINIEDISISVEEDDEKNFLTELGILFVKSCLEKSEQ